MFVKIVNRQYIYIVDIEALLYITSKNKIFDLYKLFAKKSRAVAITASNKKEF